MSSFGPLMKVLAVKLTVPLEEYVYWVYQRQLEKYDDMQEQCVRNGWITNMFFCRGRVLSHLQLHQKDKRKYNLNFKKQNKL